MALFFFSCFLNKGLCIFIFHWVLLIIRLATSFLYSSFSPNIHPGPSTESLTWTSLPHQQLLSNLYLYISHCTLTFSINFKHGISLLSLSFLWRAGTDLTFLFDWPWTRITGALIARVNSSNWQSTESRAPGLGNLVAQWTWEAAVEWMSENHWFWGLQCYFWFQHFMVKSGPSWTDQFKCSPVQWKLPIFPFPHTLVSKPDIKFLGCC